MINLPQIKIPKLAFLILIIIALFCFFIILILILGLKPKPPVQITTQTPTNLPANKITKPIPLIKFNGENQISASQSGSFSLEIVPTQELKALVYRLEIFFDPKLLSVANVKAGPFFKNPKILRDEIDNKNGRVYFSAGVSPDEMVKTGEPKSTKLLATLSFNVKPINNLIEPKQTAISFGEKTLIASKETQFENLNLVLKPIIIVIK